AAGDHPPSDAEHPREKAEAKTELNDAAPAPAPAATVVAVGPGVGPGPVPLPSAGSR
ncbi:MAG: AraC family transcriptional regulator, partial [Planctomycetes bacterium]|nr:AraC family transcriptional regulator [Planctomycetota bacterium]